MEKLFSLTTEGFITQWVIVAILAVLLIYKSWPDIKKALNSWRTHENDREGISTSIKRHEEEIEKINEKLERDYVAINEMRKTLNLQRKVTEESLEEREIIMRSLLGVLKGLQEIGANGPTKEAQAEIEAYINKQAHEPWTE
ncbi:MAG: hypothetical protein ACLSUP_02795 [Blautia massiliensis (ex Durand et al. 2017)]|uniref:hypothetical protein n=1 Tax=Blautia massiliensis (ex Durand et al. 2017) TaxID=1737424 RepID=UPI0039951B2D